MTTDTTPSANASGGHEMYLEVLARLTRALREDPRAEVDLTLDLGERYGRQARADDVSLARSLELLLGVDLPQRQRPHERAIAAVVTGWQGAAHRGEGVVTSQGSRLSSPVERLTALHHIIQAATASLNLDAMLQTVVRVVRESVGGDSCSIFLYDPASNMLTLRATVGLNQDAVGRVTLALGMGITGAAALERRLIAVVDAASHPNYLDYPLIGDQSYTSQVSVPLALRSPDRLVGVLNILTLARRTFDSEELAFLETAAGEMSIAIENARLYSQTDAELHRRVAQLSTLQQMSRLVASTLDLPELLRLISQQTVELTGSAAVALYRLPRNTTEQFELLSRYPDDTISAHEPYEDDLRVLVGDVIDTGTSIWRHFVAASGEIYVHALPMITGRRAVGALCIIFGERPAKDPESEGILHAFSDSAAIAIENAELYDEALRGYRRASTLLQEMHHRVRNNLQTVAALLSMQARRGAGDDWAAPLNQAVRRIQSIAAVHDLLSGGNLRETTVDTICRYVADEVSMSLIDPSRTIEIVVEPSSIRVSSRQATILALLVNEFITNSITHGLPGRAKGRIEIRTRQEEEEAILEVMDDGRGIEPGLDLTTTRGLGLQIARTLAEVDLRGSLSIGNGSEGGALVELRFRTEDASSRS